LAIGPPAVDALLQVLQDSVSGEERRSAAILLGGLQDARAIAPLLEIVHNDEDILTRRMATRGLSRLQLPEAVPALEAVLATDEDRFVRMSAAYGLAQLGRPQGVTALTNLYYEASRDGNGRWSAFQSLMSLDNAQVLPVMHEVAITEPEVGYRLRAIQFLAKNGNQQSLPILQQIMANADEQPSIREAAEQAYMAIPKAAARKP
jgi:HEAT repeat protein